MSGSYDTDTSGSLPMLVMISCVRAYVDAAHTHSTAESGNVHIVPCKVNEATRKLSHEYESGASCLCASPIYI